MLYAPGAVSKRSSPSHQLVYMGSNMCNTVHKSFNQEERLQIFHRVDRNTFFTYKDTSKKDKVTLGVGGVMQGWVFSLALSVPNHLEVGYLRI